MKKVYFAWSGLPDYAARCIRAVINSGAFQVTVIATRPDVPIEGMERSLGQEVIWIDGKDGNLDFNKLDLAPPDMLLCGGYAIPAFRSLTAACNRRNLPVILLSDNYLEGSLLKRIARGVRYRVLFGRRYRGVLVPGEAGRAHAREMGHRPEEIRTGLYSADPRLFHNGMPLAERKKRFLFVGRFIDRKNVMGLVEAFTRFAQDHSDWELHLCGSGPQRDDMPGHAQIIVHDFVQPLELACMMREARCLVLPSLKENFGLVVHEAALSGCALALSNKIGAASDLATTENGIVFPVQDTDAIQNALERMAVWSNAKWNRAGAVSVQLAARLSPIHFADSVEAFVQEHVE